ncbi:CD209 antigen-like protein C [Mytilus trossulus]|uniref:CD209 antigen-like protein C n=1 Tax=Mytilus trossulus TaxID=6551 RepID=UPI0030051B60
MGSVNSIWETKDARSVAINECASNPCGSHGHCTDGVNRFTCSCVGGYTGLRCQTAPQCPYNWKLYNGHCYLFATQKLTWHDAKNACSRASSYLAVVDNRYEDMWIQSNLIDGAWIDATDYWHEGRWISSNYGKNLPYTRWRGGEPNNSGGNEDCAYMRADGWNDCPCNEHAIPQYVCEKIL